jgi:peptide/nickel transport system permease protein/oligopeptide transport system permease protein
MSEIVSPAIPLAKPDRPKQRSPLYFAWRRFSDNKAAVGAGIVLIILIVMAILAPWITGTGGNEQAFLTEALAFPSPQHWFGIDDLGRDFFGRIVYGARVSLGIGFSAALFSLVVGLPLGALAGYLGGRFDWVIMRIVELFSVVPPLLAALLLASVTRGGLWAISLIAALFGWVNVCLLVRAQVKSFREKEFIIAAQALGASPWHIIWRHLIPNSISPIIVGFVLAIPLAMMLEASPSFLGIGVQPPTPIWGQMISVGMNFMFFYWHMAVFPTAALAITILSASLLGDGLRDAFDPTLKGR